MKAIAEKSINETPKNLQKNASIEKYTHKDFQQKQQKSLNINSLKFINDSAIDESLQLSSGISDDETTVWDVPNSVTTEQVDNLENYEDVFGNSAVEIIDTTGQPLQNLSLDASSGTVVKYTSAGKHIKNLL